MRPLWSASPPAHSHAVRRGRSLLGWLAATALTCLAASGCAAVVSGAPTYAGPPPATDEPPGGASHLQADVEVTLEDNGESPREELRFSYDEGDEFDLELSMGISLDQSIGDTPGMSLEIDGIVTPFTIEVDSVTDGVADFTTTYGKPRVTGRPNPEIEKSLAALEGETMQGQIDELGLSGTTSDPLEEDSTGLGSLVTQQNGGLSYVSAPLPEEAVGVGATWTTVKTETLPNGLEQTTSADYTLVSKKGSLVELEFEGTVTSPAGQIESEGQQIEMKDSSGTVEGSCTMDLDNGFGNDCEVTVVLHQEIETPGQGSALIMQDITTTVHVSPV